MTIRDDSDRVLGKEAMAIRAASKKQHDEALSNIDRALGGPGSGPHKSTSVDPPRISREEIDKSYADLNERTRQQNTFVADPNGPQHQVTDKGMNGMGHKVIDTHSESKPQSAWEFRGKTSKEDAQAFADKYNAPVRRGKK